MLELRSLVTTPLLASFPSPSRGVWYVGPLALRAYALFIIAGIVIAVIWGGKRYVARGGAPGRIGDLAVWCVPFGLVGGRLYHVITDHELYFGAGRNPWKAFAIWEGGLGIWGAVALGAVGLWLGCRHYKIPMAPVADALAAPLIVAQAIGRLGNYFNQELFGSLTTLPWGLEVFARTPDGVPAAVDACIFPGGGAPEFSTTYIKATPEVLCGTYQPTFLYELLWNLLVAALIVWADKRFRLGGGRVFALYVAGYTAGRVWIEALRIDPARTMVFGLRVNIVVSIVVFVLAVIFLIARRGVKREDPVLVAGTGGADDVQIDATNTDGAPHAGEQGALPDPDGDLPTEPGSQDVDYASEVDPEPAATTVDTAGPPRQDAGTTVVISKDVVERGAGDDSGAAAPGGPSRD
ncbi:prolipoprotein diacylglyceryl transferase [Nakamurella sp. A5-74]|uniref:Phosphatidylglycerol--prolipoprotein diacylglyceryl transferase n=1 Tax=Nakamurella sp. A5-74 TaxID=3158264 RepID=A0AAU8DT78_9ACTN